MHAACLPHLYSNILPLQVGLGLCLSIIDIHLDPAIKSVLCGIRPNRFHTRASDLLYLTSSCCLTRRLRVAVKTEMHELLQIRGAVVMIFRCVTPTRLHERDTLAMLT